MQPVLSSAGLLRLPHVDGVIVGSAPLVVAAFTNCMFFNEMLFALMNSAPRAELF